MRAAAPASSILSFSALALAGLTSMALLWLPGCGEQEPEVVSVQEMDWPEGTVMVLDGWDPITAEDVDYWNEGVLLVEPGSSLNAQRRFALTNTVLPLRIGSTLDQVTREEVRVQAQEYLTFLQAGEELPAMAPEVEEVLEGYWKFLGLDVWQLARHVPLGEWQLEETVGAYVLFRVLSRDDEPWNHLSKAQVERVILPYLDGQLAAEVIQQAIDQTRIDILDETWREIVPARYLY